MSQAEGETFEQLRSKVKQLIEMFLKEKEENEMLSRERMELQEQNRLDRNRLKDLEEKYNKLKISRALIASSQDIHDAKLKVNRMVREIDKCIALLNR